MNQINHAQNPGIQSIFQDYLRKNDDGHVLVDGGIMSNFPVDVMRARMGTGLIIGMNMGSVGEGDRQYQLEASISGWQVLRSRIDPWAERIETPLLAGILMRSLMVNNQRWAQQAQQVCDLLIEPDVRQFGLLQFSEYAPIAEVGYSRAKSALASWQQPVRVTEQNHTSNRGCSPGSSHHWGQLFPACKGRCPHPFTPWREA